MDSYPEATSWITLPVSDESDSEPELSATESTTPLTSFDYVLPSRFSLEVNDAPTAQFLPELCCQSSSGPMIHAPSVEDPGSSIILPRQQSVDTTAAMMPTQVGESTPEQNILTSSQTRHSALPPPPDCVTDFPARADCAEKKALRQMIRSLAVSFVRESIQIFKNKRTSSPETMLSILQPIIADEISLAFQSQFHSAADINAISDVSSKYETDIHEVSSSVSSSADDHVTDPSSSNDTKKKTKRKHPAKQARKEKRAKSISDDKEEPKRKKVRKSKQERSKEANRQGEQMPHDDIKPVQSRKQENKAVVCGDKEKEEARERRQEAIAIAKMIRTTDALEERVKLAQCAAQMSPQDRVQKAYEAIMRAWPNALRARVEPLIAAKLADLYYRAYLPKDCRTELLVLSESHAFTCPELLERRVREEYREGLAPDGHLNLVHALSYGEPWILEENDPESTSSFRKSDEVELKEKKNWNLSLSSGTTAFWRVLAVLAGMFDEHDEQADCLSNRELFKDAFAGIMGGGPRRREQRLQCKREVLDKMAVRGVVLADVSPVAVYLPSRKIIRENKMTGRKYWTQNVKDKLSSLEYRNVMRDAFQYYAAPLIHELKPRRIVLLGNSVLKAIGPEELKAHADLAGAIVLPTVRHPSDIHFQGFNYACYLRILRAYARGEYGEVEWNETESELVERSEMKKARKSSFNVVRLT